MDIDVSKILERAKRICKGIKQMEKWNFLIEEERSFIFYPEEFQF